MLMAIESEARRSWFAKISVPPWRRGEHQVYEACERQRTFVDIEIAIVLRFHPDKGTSGVGSVRDVQDHPPPLPPPRPVRLRLRLPLRPRKADSGTGTGTAVRQASHNAVSSHARDPGTAATILTPTDTENGAEAPWTTTAADGLLDVNGIAASRPVPWLCNQVHGFGHLGPRQAVDGVPAAPLLRSSG